MGAKYTDAQYKATNKYKAAKYKRIPLDVSIEFYQATKAAADAAGESLNGYIKRAILERAERDQD